jgi:integrase
MKLTTANVAKLTLPAGKSDHIEFDDDVVGWGLRLRSSGKPTWIYQYRVGPRSRRMTLGTLAALSPSVARETAVKLYSKVRLGGDPANEKERAKAATALAETFGDGVALYLKRQGQRLRARSLVEVTRHLNVHAKPLHRLQLVEIDRRAIARLVSALADSSGAVAANRTGSSIAAFFAWAIREGWIDHNVAATLNKQHEQPRSRVLSDSELRRIWAATSGADQYSSIVRLLMLTGCRREEIGGLQWSEIDFDKALITLPPARTKTKREHLVPLSAMAIEVLEAQPRRDREHVFGERPTHGFRGWSPSKAKLDERAGIEPGWVLHDLRRTVSTRMNGELGIAPHIVESVLAHVGHKSGVAGVYNKAAYTNEKRQALAQWCEHVLAIVEDRPAKVVSLRA